MVCKLATVGFEAGHGFALVLVRMASMAVRATISVCSPWVSARRHAVEDAFSADPAHLMTFVQDVKRGSWMSRTGVTFTGRGELDVLNGIMRSLEVGTL